MLCVPLSQRWWRFMLWRTLPQGTTHALQNVKDALHCGLLLCSQLYAGLYPWLLRPRLCPLLHPSRVRPLRHCLYLCP